LIDDPRLSRRTQRPELGPQRGRADRPPPLGNALAARGERMPFVLWFGVALFDFAALWLSDAASGRRQLDAGLDSLVNSELHKRSYSDP